jgi:hypothetical protein
MTIIAGTADQTLGQPQPWRQPLGDTPDLIADFRANAIARQKQ